MSTTLMSSQITYLLLTTFSQLAAALGQSVESEDIHQKPFEKRKWKLSALNQTPIRLPQQVCSLLISNKLVTDCLCWAMDPQILSDMMGATGE